VVLNEKGSEKIKREIKENLENYFDSESGLKPFRKVWFKEEVYKGDYLANAPDIIIEEDGRYAFKTEWSLKEIDDSSQYGAVKSGSHRPNGFLIMYGSSFKKGRKIEDANITDICPTVLNLLGLPIGSEMDGKVLGGCFSEQKEVLFEDYAKIRDKSTSGSDIHEEEIKEKLKNLGYM
ncbi:MAG: hypothetical protein N2445_04380, partial [Acidobacteria bacterium]|nr:hypothetical protein [Acidobacteriota bacterium]